MRSFTGQLMSVVCTLGSRIHTVDADRKRTRSRDIFHRDAELLAGATRWTLSFLHKDRRLETILHRTGSLDWNDMVPAL